jgi:hypothetical protein
MKDFTQESEKGERQISSVTGAVAHEYERTLALAPGSASSRDL